ncbi:MAG: hypothetical protein ACOCQD_05110 [archaeon]
MGNLLIVDGNQIAFKCFITMGNFSTHLNGERIGTGIFFGFIKSLIKLNQDFRGMGIQFDKIIVTWDRGNKLRQDIDPTYKQKRKEDRKDDSDFDFEDFKKQVNLVEEYLPMMNIEQIYRWQNEADDVINTICINNKDKYDCIVVASNDHDLCQVIDDNVWVYQDKKNGGLYDVERFTEEKGIDPRAWTYIMSLTGCSTDEVKGIYRVGEKTAVKMLQENPELVEAILCDDKDWVENNFTGTKNKKEKIFEYWDVVKKANRLVQLYCLEPEDLKIIPAKKNDMLLRSVINRYNMGSLLKPTTWKEITNIGVRSDDLDVIIEDFNDGFEDF